MDRPTPRSSFHFFSRKDSKTKREHDGPGWAAHPKVWMAVYVVVTSLAFAPGISFQAVQFKAGTVARSDVVAPRDFIMPDLETTARKREEAAGRVLPVYDHDTAAASRLEEALHRSFEAARQAERPFPAPSLPARNLDAVRTAFALPIGDQALKALVRLHFSPDLESRLSAAITKLYRSGVVENKELLLQNKDRGVILRETDGGEKETLDLFSTIEYGGDAKATVAIELAGSRLTPSEVREVAAFLAAALRPNLTYNAAETAHRRQLAASQVESAFVKIPRGEVIVRRGDQISPRTAQIIALVKGSAAEPQAWWKLFGVLLLQVLAAWVFRLDSEIRLKATRAKKSGLLPILGVGIVSALVVRAGFSVAQALGARSYEFAIPFATGPIIAVLVAGVGPAVLFATVQALGVGVLTGMNASFAFLAVLSSLAGIYGLKRLRSRGVLAAVGCVVAAANVIAAAVLWALSGEGAVLAEFLGGALGGLVVAALVAFLLPLFEGVFHVTTDIRLLELSDQNLPLLKALAFEAPGTYQHSLAVGHLAEAGAEAIGENALLARICAYYHDIGKTRMPEYFIENQPRGKNRHDRLEPSMSALIIASHVREGVDLARKNRLPDPIVTGIREHHGTKLIRYFYQKALTKSGPEGGVVSETDYRYPGPKPSTRVTGILMIADAVEAASRTIQEPTAAKIAAMVRAISSDCLRDGQFDDCDLTLKDLTAVNEALIRTVTMMFHHRIDYPGFDFNQLAPAPRATGAARATSR
jgi:putative nucleotidyltransferase with HDIG domain